MGGGKEKDNDKDNKQKKKMKQRGKEQSVNPRQYLLRHYSACNHTVISTAVSDVSESTTRNVLTTAN
jgi:hypothetical protein